MTIKIQKSLLSYQNSIIDALGLGKGKYKYLPAETLHGMLLFSDLIKEGKIRQAKKMLNETGENILSSDATIPAIIDDYLSKTNGQKI